MAGIAAGGETIIGGTAASCAHKQWLVKQVRSSANLVINAGNLSAAGIYGSPKKMKAEVRRRKGRVNLIL